MTVLKNYGNASYYRNMKMLLTVDTINSLFSLGNSKESLSNIINDTDAVPTTTNNNNNNSNPTTSSTTTTTNTNNQHMQLNKENSHKEEDVENSNNNIFKNLRSLGLVGINSLDVLKKIIAKYAMGS